MTREEAIQWLTDIKNVTENWSQEVAIDMAIEALLADAPIKVYETFCGVPMKEAVGMMQGYVNGEYVKVVRCKDYKHGEERKTANYLPFTYCTRQKCSVKADDYCSHGERAEQTKYPATYNINPKCGGCVHLDELGRCLNFMLAKPDRSCWRGSWENNMGGDAEQTDELLTHEQAWADIDGRPHGEWEHWGSPFSDESEVIDTIVCSVCGARFIEPKDEPKGEYNYCPNCGARMKGGA
jgi:hypothetical protein